MKFIKTPLKGAYILEQDPFVDERGSFSKLFCKKEFAKALKHKKEILQINHSVNIKKRTIRGMHYQLPPHTETKIVKCIKGSVYDVIIDLRKGSKTFLHWFGTELSDKNKRMLYIPDGFAHGFETLENNSELIYFHTGIYEPESEASINFNDPMVKIKWPLPIKVISEKDRNYAFLKKEFRGI